LADCDGGYEKSEKCDPIFGLGDRERAERRQEEKLKQATPSNEASTAGFDPQAVATKRTIKSSDSATVVGLTWPPKNFEGGSRRSNNNDGHYVTGELLMDQRL